MALACLASGASRPPSAVALHDGRTAPAFEEAKREHERGMRALRAFNQALTTGDLERARAEREQARARLLRSARLLGEALARYREPPGGPLREAYSEYDGLYAELARGLTALARDD